MGIDANLIHLIAKSKSTWGLSGSVCTLGVATLRSDLHEVDRAIKSAGISPADNSDSKDPFLRMGFSSVDSIDVSAYENCTHIVDLNSEHLPPILKGRFDLIYDGGTLEHVFDVRMSFRNIFEMLCEGGVAIHFLPMNGWVDHGFYQFSPTLLTDYYSDNEYSILEGYMLKYEPSRASVLVNPYVPGAMDVVPDGSITGSWLSYFVVRKNPRSTWHRVPTQRRYRNQRGDGAARMPFFLPYRLINGQRNEIPVRRQPITSWEHGQGQELLFRIPRLSALSDSATGFSPLVLFEDAQLIGPPHSLHERIRTDGSGCYSHWGEWLHFSASDGQPERHKYEYAVPVMADASGLSHWVSDLLTRLRARCL